MASKAFKLRIKAEKGDEEENKNGNPAPPAQQVLEQHGNAADANAGLIPSNDSLLEVPPSKAALTSFPPGCPVLFTDTRVVPNTVSGAMVVNVFVDLTPRVSCDYAYKVRLQNQQKTIIAREEELQWAPQCTVWMKPLWKQDTQDLEWQEALILGSYTAMGDKSPLYSVQQVETGNETFHGLTKDYIRYRPTFSENEQQVVSSPTLTRSINGKRIIALAEAEDSINSNKVVPAIPASEPSPCSSLNHPPSHSNIQTAVPTKPSRVTMSPRKRPFLEAPEPLETLVQGVLSDVDPTMGRCTAEFRMPYWMQGARLNGDFIDQACLGCKQCTDCHLVILEASSPTTNKKGSASSLVGQSIFIYGRGMQNVEHACTLVSHLLHEYVKKPHKKKLAAELKNGWRKTIHDEENAQAENTSNGSRGTIVPGFEPNESSKKKAKKKAKTGARSPSSEEGEIVESSLNMLLPSQPPVMDEGEERKNVEPTSTALPQKGRSNSEGTAAGTTLFSATTAMARSLPPASEEDEEKEHVELTSTTLLQKGHVNSKDIADSNAVLSAKTEVDCLLRPIKDEGEIVEELVESSLTPLPQKGRTISEDTADEILRNSSAKEEEYSTGKYVAEPVEQGPLTRIIRVPQFTNQHYLEDALVGENEENRKRMLEQTGCDICIKYPTKPNDLIKVALYGELPNVGDMDFAQRWVENRIVSTVPDDQKGRMLYYLAKDNNYGACEGEARYQRSPYDLETWCWMGVVELPPGFKRLHGLFIDAGGRGIKTIVRDSGCRHIILSESLPHHVFLLSENLEVVEAGLQAVNARVAWTLREANSRKKRW